MPQVQENEKEIAVVIVSLGFVLLVLALHKVLRFVKNLINPLEGKQIDLTQTYEEFRRVTNVLPLERKEIYLTQTYEEFRRVTNVLPLEGKQIEVIQTFEECQRVTNVLKKHCVDYKVLGFDCEWVQMYGNRPLVALLQLSSHNGLCALFRLCCLQQIPRSLRELLEDDSVIKVGVDPRGDAEKLASDYGVDVTSTFDLQYLAELTQHKPEGLAKLAHAVLNVKLEKGSPVAYSNWEAFELNTKQLHYAANEALVAVEIFKKLSKNLIQRIYCNSLKPDMKHIFAQFLDRRYY